MTATWLLVVERLMFWRTLLPMQSHPPTPNMRTTALLGSSWECLSAAAGLSYVVRIICLSCPFTDRLWHSNLYSFSYSPWVSKSLRIKIWRYLQLVWLCHGSRCWSPASPCGLDRVPVCGIFNGRSGTGRGFSRSVSFHRCHVLFSSCVSDVPLL